MLNLEYTLNVKANQVLHFALCQSSLKIQDTPGSLIRKPYTNVILLNS